MEKETKDFFKGMGFGVLATIAGLGSYSLAKSSPKVHVIYEGRAPIKVERVVSNVEKEAGIERYVELNKIEITSDTIKSGIGDRSYRRRSR